MSPASRDSRLRWTTDAIDFARLASLTSFFPIPAVRAAGISRDSLHKRRNTGGKQKPWRKKRKYVPSPDLSATRATRRGPLATRFYHRVSRASAHEFTVRDARRDREARGVGGSTFGLRERDALRVCAY